MSEQNQAGRACFRTMIGGQALIEGIMMRGPKEQAIVVRRPDGELEVKVEPLKLIKDRFPVLGWPLIRGTVTFLDSMVKGVKALMYSAEFYPEDEDGDEQSKFDLWLEKKLGSEKAARAAVFFAVFLGVAFSVGLFMLLPTFLTGVVARFIPWNIVRNLVEGAVRIALFLAYVMLCSRLEDIKRVFRYHGAEHQTIFCYEAGLPLTVDNARVQPRHHPRCGTSFLFVVMIVSILVYSLVSWDRLWVRIVLRIVLLPVIVGVTYEINRYVGRHDNPLTRVVTAPGLWLQNWTTSEPDDSMLEVAIAALKLVIPEQTGADAW